MSKRDLRNLLNSMTSRDGRTKSPSSSKKKKTKTNDNLFHCPNVEKAQAKRNRKKQADKDEDELTALCLDTYHKKKRLYSRDRQFFSTFRDDVVFDPEEAMMENDPEPTLEEARKEWKRVCELEAQWQASGKQEEKSNQMDEETVDPNQTGKTDDKESANAPDTKVGSESANAPDTNVGSGSLPDETDSGGVQTPGAQTPVDKDDLKRTSRWGDVRDRESRERERESLERIKRGDNSVNNVFRASNGQIVTQPPHTELYRMNHDLKEKFNTQVETLHKILLRTQLDELNQSQQSLLFA